MRALLCLISTLLVPWSIAQEGDPSPAPPPAAADPGLAAKRARSAAHDVAAAGAYHQRAALWERKLEGDKVALLPVQLYSGNEYQIIVGFDAPSAVIGISVFDARDRLVPAGVHRGEGKMVLALKPGRSEVYKVRLRLADPASPPAVAALTYVYK